MNTGSIGRSMNRMITELRKPDQMKAIKRSCKKYIFRNKLNNYNMKIINKKSKCLIILIFIFAQQVFGQINLVPNPSFEQYDTCPYNGGQIQYALSWINPATYSTPDYFNACGIGGHNVPNTVFGQQIARTGTAYAGIVTYTNNPNWPPQNNAREYIEVLLNDTLEFGKKYCVSFFVNKADSVQYVSNDIGAYFSAVPDTISSPQGYYVFPYIPQISNPINNLLTNDTGWTEISGIYVATGGEKYMIIGNFNDFASTTATFVGGPSWAYYGFYYIDDVSVIECGTADNSEIITKNKLNVFPNPAKNELIIDMESPNKYSFNIFDLLGSKMESFSFDNSSNKIDLTNVSDGTYIFTITDHKENKIKTDKLIIIK